MSTEENPNSKPGEYTSKIQGSLKTFSVKFDLKFAGAVIQIRFQATRATFAEWVPALYVTGFVIGWMEVQQISDVCGSTADFEISLSDLKLV